MDENEEGDRDLWKAISTLTTEVKLIKKDIHWIKRIVQWVIVGVAAMLGIQIPMWV